MDFVDRLLTCADCRQGFIFTAGEQLFFFDKQFKNDPKRCKGCKSRRASGVPSVPGAPVMTGFSRTETRTLCSDCGLETTVPFKPTQGRPVLCRQCFQTKRTPATMAAVSAAASLEQATAELIAVAANASASFEHTPSAESIAVAVQVPQA